MSVIDLLDGSFTALRQRPGTLLAVVAVVVLPFSFLEGYLSRGILGGVGLNELMEDPTLLGTGAPDAVLGVSPLVYLLDWIQLAVAGVPVALVVGGWLHGEDTGTVQALTFTVRRSWAIATAFVLIHVAELAGLALLVLPGLFAVLVFSLTSPVLALEPHLGPVAAMARSARLARRRLGSVIAVVVLTALVGYGVSNAVELLPGLVSVFIGTERAWPLVAVSAMLSSLLVVPFTAGVMCLLYLDIRFRTEGLDLEVRARQLDVGRPVVGTGSGHG
jgi:hypothetical protein